jgi:AcrR family transcriptional regulator
VRVTQDVRRRTRGRLLAAAEGLVRERGFDGVTTRDVATSAGVGHGTLFNYFASREALGLGLCDVLLARAEDDVRQRPREGASLEEDLFAHGAACLRRLEPLRASAGALLAGILAHAEAAEPDEDTTPGEPLHVRGRLLHGVRAMVALHRPDRPPSPTALRLYASLFVGIVCAWSHDASPRREDTLALLDKTTRLFVASLDEDAGTSEPE